MWMMHKSFVSLWRIIGTRYRILMYYMLIWSAIFCRSASICRQSHCYICYIWASADLPTWTPACCAPLCISVNPALLWLLGSWKMSRIHTALPTRLLNWTSALFVTTTPGLTPSVCPVIHHQPAGSLKDYLRVKWSIFFRLDNLQK